jgi:mono/diheme cytochrome c family protein
MTRATIVLSSLILAACGGGLERMQEQPRADPYEATPVFANGIVLQAMPAGTVPHTRVDETEPPMSRELLAIGRRRFDTFCAACHGLDGRSDTPVALRMPLKAPPSLVSGRVLSLSAADLYRIATDGYGLMPSYSVPLTPTERWAVTAYVRALQLSDGAPLSALPADVRAEALRTLGGGQ